MPAAAKQEPTIADLVAVAGLLADIERIEAKPVDWGGGERGPDGTVHMPFAMYAPEIDHLLRKIDEHHLLLAFDWSSWRNEAERFFVPEVVREASLDDVRRLLTLHVRQERFVEGHLAEMIARGHISALLRRLQTLVTQH